MSDWKRRQLYIKKKEVTECGYNQYGCCDSHDSGWYLEKCPFKTLDECRVHKS